MSHINGVVIILGVCANCIEAQKTIRLYEGAIMRLRVFFTVLISDSLAVMLSMFYALLLTWLIEIVVPLIGVCYWLVLGAFFVILLFVNFYYCSPGYIDVSLGRDLSPERDSAWVAYFGAFVGSLFWTAVIVLQIDQAFSLQGSLSFVVSAAIFMLVFACLCIYIMRLRRRK
ncbi:hypothetical protein [Pseudomonas fluorescens]|uniref:hypothetical protein n=1 Tax=Pseudomonas fluorescens TaxID=294 RepID=UPI00163B3F33|nr:hypothetical protein [Pseudomonas fluorescens]